MTQDSDDPDPVLQARWEAQISQMLLPTFYGKGLGTIRKERLPIADLTTIIAAWFKANPTAVISVINLAKQFKTHVDHMYKIKTKLVDSGLIFKHKFPVKVEGIRYGAVEQVTK